MIELCQLFIGQALEGKPLTIYGNGEQMRSFCYVDDLIEGIYRLLLIDYNFPVNIGNPEEITINQLADELMEMTGNNLERINEPLPKGDPLKRKPDIKKAVEILDWYPKTTRKEGLKKTLDYFRNRCEKGQTLTKPKSFEQYITK